MGFLMEDSQQTLDSLAEVGEDQKRRAAEESEGGQFILRRET